MGINVGQMGLAAAQVSDTFHIHLNAAFERQYMLLALSAESHIPLPIDTKGAAVTRFISAHKVARSGCPQLPHPSWIFRQQILHSRSNHNL